MISLLLLFVTATYRPTAPTVGDPITIDYSRPVVVAPSPDFEIVSQQGSRVVVRTFDTKPITVHATATDGEEVGDVVIGMKSVLAPNDQLKPAPLQPPRELPTARLPYVAIGVTALAAALAWAAVYLLSRRTPKALVVVAPDARFRAAVAGAKSWAALADATRVDLAATRPDLSLDLTTSEVLSREPRAATILRQGDLEKFSPWGPEALDFDAVARQALELA
jgi:hypothetical protein